MEKSINLSTDLTNISDNKLMNLWGVCIGKLTENNRDELQKSMMKKIYSEGCRRGYVLARDAWS